MAIQINTEDPTPLSGSMTFLKDWNGNGWGDGNSDAFDSFGGFKLKHTGVEYSLSGYLSGGDADGVLMTTTPTFGGQRFTIRSGWWVYGGFMIEVIPDDPDLKFQIKATGGLGSDSATQSITKEVTGKTGKGGSTVTITTAMTNDGTFTDVGGDPMIFYAAVPFYKQDFPDGGTMDFAISGDTPTIYTADTTGGMTFVMSWTTDDEAEDPELFYDWILANLDSGSLRRVWGYTVTANMRPVTRNVHLYSDGYVASVVSDPATGQWEYVGNMSDEVTVVVEDPTGLYTDELRTVYSAPFVEE